MVNGVIQLGNPKCRSHWLHVYAMQQHPALFWDLHLEIADFTDMFGEREAKQLPLHLSYNWPINLVLNAKLPVGWIYSLSKPELEALKDFIEKNLKNGFTHPMTSSLAALLLFVKKKSRELCFAVTIVNSMPLPRGSCTCSRSFQNSWSSKGGHGSS